MAGKNRKSAVFLLIFWGILLGASGSTLSADRSVVATDPPITIQQLHDADQSHAVPSSTKRSLSGDGAGESVSGSLVNLRNTLYFVGGLFLLTLLFSLILFAVKNRQIRAQYQVLARQSDELNTAKDRLVQVQKIANIGHWEWDILSGDFYWSEEVYEMFHQSHADFTPSYAAFLALIHPEDRGMAEKRLVRAVERGLNYDSIYRILLASGDLRYLHEITQVERNETGQGVKIIGSVQDVTDLKLTEKSLIDKTAYLDSILSSTNTVSIIATDPELTVNYFNSTAERVFGLPRDEVMGKNLSAIHESLGVNNRRLERALSIARNEKEFRFDIQQERDGDTQHIASRLSPIWNSHQELIGYLLLSEDMTDHKRSAALIERQANYDALTELPNRRLLLDRLKQVLAQSKRHGHTGALLFFDLDNFKTINDSLGHPVGDELLQQVAERMRRALREEDTISRLGGDEFVILISEIDDDTNEAVNVVQALAEKIRHSVSQPYLIQERTLHVTPSIGIALFPLGDETPTDVLRAADTAMYRAKDSGRNAIRFFLPSMQLAAEERLKIINDLRQAEKYHQLKVFFQPQIEASGRVVGAEALLRWDHPERGFISPDEFIPLAEESRQIISIGRWVLEHTLREFKRFRREVPHMTMNRIAVNVSPVQFRQSDYAYTVEQTLARVGMDPNILTLELTEGMLIADLDSTIEKMDRLKRIGVRFSIDDFGTGYSSLAYLKRLPLDEIKIDKSFIEDMLDDPNDAMIVETILTMAQQLGLESIAEGVEHLDELEFLKPRGCQLFQGYYFGKPMQARDFIEFLKHHPEPTGTRIPKVVPLH